MAVAKGEAYMLGRDAIESARLDRQHNLLKSLTGNHLLHPTVLKHRPKTIADVATGTGTWLIDLAASLPNTEPAELVGFDISSQQFPQTHGAANLAFVVHDAKAPFPEKWLGYFDVVHIRLLSYAIRTEDLETVVANVVQLLRPGGFLDWQEGDPGDIWGTPETEHSRNLLRYILEERIARGLTPAIVPPLMDVIGNLRMGAGAGAGEGEGAAAGGPACNGLTSPDDRQMRFVHVESISSAEAPSPTVHELKNPIFLTTGLYFLKAGAARRRDSARDHPEGSDESQALIRQAEAMEKLEADLTQEGLDFVLDFTVVWLVARKAWRVDGQQQWIGTGRWVAKAD